MSGRALPHICVVYPTTHPWALSDFPPDFREQFLLGQIFDLLRPAYGRTTAYGLPNSALAASLETEELRAVQINSVDPLLCLVHRFKDYANYYMTISMHIS